MSDTNIIIEQKADYRIAARVWWAWAWRTLLVSFAFGFIIGLISGITSKLLHIDGKHAGTVASITILLSICGGVSIGIWFIKYALNKKYGDFRIAIIRN